MQSINNFIIRTKCPIDMKQTAFEKEFHKLSIYAKSYIIMAYDQFRLVLPQRLTYTFVLKVLRYRTFKK